jgi:hypothetical protein
MKNLLFHLKAVKTGTHKAQVGAGAGAESNSFGSATLLVWTKIPAETSNPTEGHEGSL